MAYRLLIVLFLLCSVPTVAAPIASPSQFLGFEVGADRKLADYGQITAYFRMLDQASERIELVSLGETTLGADMLMAVISSEDNIRNLPRLREISRRLSDPRGLNDAAIAELVREGKTIVLVTCNIHSSEIASSQMAMEWAHALATAQDAETKRRLANVVLLLVPSLNPDGQSMETDEAGRFRLPGLVPGDYRLYAWEDIESGSWLDETFMSTVQIPATSVRLAEGGRVATRLVGER